MSCKIFDAWSSLVWRSLLSMGRSACRKRVLSSSWFRLESSGASFMTVWSISPSSPRPRGGSPVRMPVGRWAAGQAERFFWLRFRRLSLRRTELAEKARYGWILQQFADFSG